MDVQPPERFAAVPAQTSVDGPIAVELIPAPEPWEVARKLAHLPHLLFLDSAERHRERGRYSYVMAEPRTFISANALDCAPFGLDSLIQSMLEERPAIGGLPPFQGGLAGLFGYGLGREFERVPAPRTNDFGIPDLHLGVYDCVVSFDHNQNRAWIVSGGKECEARLQETIRLLQTNPAILAAPSPAALASLAPQFPLPGSPGVTSNFNRAGYEAAVAKVVEYIRAGDCYQVNLSQRLLAPLREHPLELYGQIGRAHV